MFAGLALGYVAAAIVYFVIAMLVGRGVMPSESGGWREAGAVRGTVWLGIAGIVTGALQVQALRSRRRWWIWASALVWALSHPLNMWRRGLAGDVDLAPTVVPAVVFSLFVGGLVLLRSGRGSTSAASS